jgi:hypothetical protein
MSRNITVDHKGTTYAGEIMRIESTRFGYEDHGILTVMLDCRSEGGGVGVGGFCLDQPVPDDPKHRRQGTAYGLDHLIRIIETVGVSSWEKLVGQHVIVLSEGSGGWGSRSLGIASLTGDRVLILQDHAEEWEARESAGARS